MAVDRGELDAPATIAVVAARADAPYDEISEALGRLANAFAD
jgi:hypothetical protein